ncbi:hypothetical protein AVEN_118801-1 [Araneus ventricosus]|uniref:Histone-lysine N-methyltransferase SETMAR n=1 Tax=Araneus ventricosus TaxID=182803 RepID=A0A4Y2BYR7_ARAVE|nr:hypothetical protein AVEN_118801-1 [Araneus ventricosus]
MLSRIVTGGKTWVSHVLPESKQQSMEWRDTHSPERVKAKQTLSQLKIMVSVFWDRHGVLLVDPPPPYSPDLAPSDFHLFRHLKHHLGGNHYKEDVKTAVTSWLSEQAAIIYEEGIQNLVVRYDKCLNKLGSFVEK